MTPLMFKKKKTRFNTYHSHNNGTEISIKNYYKLFYVDL